MHESIYIFQGFVDNETTVVTYVSLTGSRGAEVNEKTVRTGNVWKSMYRPDMEHAESFLWLNEAWIGGVECRPDVDVITPALRSDSHAQVWRHGNLLVLPQKYLDMESTDIQNNKNKTRREKEQEQEQEEQNGCQLQQEWDTIYAWRSI